MPNRNLQNKYSKYRFEIRHLTIFLSVLILFQIIMAFVQKTSLNSFLEETQSWYREYSAERLANITTTSMELLFENLFIGKDIQNYEERKIVYSFNVIFKQQRVQKSVEDICLILVKNHRLYIIDSGSKLNDYLNNRLQPYEGKSNPHSEGIKLFLSVKNRMKASEVSYSVLKNQTTYNILVPFVPDGEYLGVMYIRITPDFSFLEKGVTDGFDKEALVYSSLIFIGLIAVFLVSSQAVKERNEAQQKLYEEHEENLKKQIKLEKESLFTKRIYHTHHKAEKIIGFIKDDVRKIDPVNIEQSKKRVITYSNFISRIIYDMKWYDQDINTIINPMFCTNINNVIEFIIENVFLRISSKNEMFEIEMNLDRALPAVSVNEFVVWEILEPIIQNSIDHGKVNCVKIKVTTRYDQENRQSYISVEDNGVGISGEMLEENEKGIKRLFLEEQSTKRVEGANSGYGCYIAYQMAVSRCGWSLDVENLEGGGCRFVIIIKN